MFFFQCYVHHRDLHSFPTRRSSDLNANWLFQCLRCSLNLFDRASPPVIKVLRGSGNGCNFSTIASPPLQQDSKVPATREREDRKSTRLNSSHANISYAVFCLKKKKN